MTAVVLHVSDLPRMAAFYGRGGFGLAPTRSAGPGFRTLVAAAGGRLDSSAGRWQHCDLEHLDGVDHEGNVFQLRAPARNR